MKLTGPYQHCTKCNKNTNHYWVNAKVYACSNCEKQTTTQPRSVIIKEVIAPVIEPMQELMNRIKEIKYRSFKNYSNDYLRRGNARLSR